MIWLAVPIQTFDMLGPILGIDIDSRLRGKAESTSTASDGNEIAPDVIHHTFIRHAVEF